ncbi:patatin-like phospholipase family protein [Limnobacter parvus]|uniref:Patatin-like phospholipase family protein n=1 Tax=Limnobacter parvus TaxID=2939690 RepID=A0ABT1XG96_9BURK|nr:patatin-like phospholipase family protein [Limnobacter parvus]MCR2746292.1 patatin-like phospholipase family protein [Limnobacter parvus]
MSEHDTFHSEDHEDITGLVLSGGGARAAYQVGVLHQLAKWFEQENKREFDFPFKILCGTSAGAINAAALACAGRNFYQSTDRMLKVWENFSSDQVFRSDSLGIIRTGARWLSALSIGWMLRKRPRCLLDNTPLSHLMNQLLHFRRLDEALENGTIHALAVTASSYSSGRSVTFFQTQKVIESWARTQRVALPDRITVEHLLASAAIPFVFPAVKLNIEGKMEHFGDGSIRQLAPISPAIHLGANRVMVIGSSQADKDHTQALEVQNAYPSLAQIAGHAMASIFLDSLSIDIERLSRVNKTLGLLPPEMATKTTLKPIELLVISPSERIDEIAARHTQDLPRPVRTLLSALGATEAGGSSLASYLLFEANYTRELIRLGIADTIAKREAVYEFFHLGQPAR